MGFVKFEKENPKKSITTNTIGINSKGRFAFYKQIVEGILKDINYVELYYDPENKIIGIKPINDSNPNTFKIQGKTTRMIVAKKFLNRFQISVNQTRYQFTQEDDMILIPIENVS